MERTHSLSPEDKKYLQRINYYHGLSLEVSNDRQADLDHFFWQFADDLNLARRRLYIVKLTPSQSELLQQTNRVSVLLWGIWVPDFPWLKFGTGGVKNHLEVRRIIVKPRSQMTELDFEKIGISFEQSRRGFRAQSDDYPLPYYPVTLIDLKVQTSFHSV